MNANQLHVVTARFNPIGWRTPHQHYVAWAQHMQDSGVALTVCELQYGARPFVCNLPGVNHIGVRADSWVWSKENLLNLAIQRLPDAQYICWEDADIFHRDPDWAAKAVEALQHYHVIQPWSQVLDMAPGGIVNSMSRSFADCYHKGAPVCADTPGWWKHDGGPYDYAHSGFSWCAKREFLNATGGLFELGGMGSGDYHMALAMVGKVEWSIVAQCSDSYRRHLMLWQDRAQRYVNGRIGVLTSTIEHKFHGPKKCRSYMGRWRIFEKHGFNPDTDLKRNSYGVLEWAGNKPELEREWDLYLRARNEDANVI